jgi:phosphoribosyl-AMP cyclohydrolase
MTYLDKAKFNQDGLLTAIVQDWKSGKVLMCAFMNREALKRTVKTGRMIYWSRSRKKLWVKGEESGNTQRVKEIRFDCDGDAALFRVLQRGGACHEGWESCFAYKVQGSRIVVRGKKLFDPKAVYHKPKG